MLHVALLGNTLPPLLPDHGARVQLLQLLQLPDERERHTERERARARERDREEEKRDRERVSEGASERNI